ncbi:MULTISPECIES: ATP-dependent RecD-like DNA helicase [unclassified Thioalkalivibrio]|uniref:SF1B family DNA helicase RecD2 n=1 Tax=unclassified Thioalkalivibrio TaxID=2621013 RepID=UPI001E5D848F|nr:MULTISPECIES: ATP-dependent RecD-like DNA helicase [unclassified Thioalkalivibrio]
MSEQEELSIEAEISRVFMHAREESGYFAMQVSDQDGADRKVVGKTPAPLAPGLTVRIRGKESVHSSYGVQVQASEIEVVRPNSEAELLRYLSSGIIKNVGPERAKKLVGALGERALEAIESGPEAVQKALGCNHKLAEKIHLSAKECSENSAHMAFLLGLGFGGRRAANIIKKLGKDTRSLIEEDPYIIYRDIRGIGFKLADAAAIKLGVPWASRRRARAGVIYALEEAGNEGHCYLPEHELVRKTMSLLEIGNDKVARIGIEEAELRGEIVRTTGADLEAVFSEKEIFEVEKDIADAIKRLSMGKLKRNRIPFEEAMKSVEASLPFHLADAQRDAIKIAHDSPVSIVTGGPGVGKTTVLSGVIEAIRKTGKSVVVKLAAPTGKAANRMTESTGVEAFTIHRLLEYGENGFARNRKNPLDVDVLAVDECSMIPAHLFRSLVEAIPDGARLVLLGDPDQLPSVGAGAVLRDLIQAGATPVARLDTIHRQGEGSAIVLGAQQVLSGKEPQPGGDLDVSFIDDDKDPSVAHPALLERFTELAEKFGPHQVQVISPQRRGVLGTDALNILLQGHLNPGIVEHRSIPMNGGIIAPGDRVIQTVNDYNLGVFNGDQGVVLEVGRSTRSMVVDVDNKGPVTFEADDLQHLKLAYAITVHKSQGSEYPGVIQVVSSQAQFMLNQRLLYTGITRGRQHTTILADRGALMRAVRASSSIQRRTRLAGLIAGAPMASMAV